MWLLRQQFDTEVLFHKDTIGQWQESDNRGNLSPIGENWPSGDLRKTGEFGHYGDKH
jgi:hypothetical protein